MPEAAPARVASPRGSTALAPHFGSHPECVPRERDFVAGNDNGDICQVLVAGMATAIDITRQWDCPMTSCLY